MFINLEILCTFPLIKREKCKATEKLVIMYLHSTTKQEKKESNECVQKFAYLFGNLQFLTR